VREADLHRDQPRCDLPSGSWGGYAKPAGELLPPPMFGASGAGVDIL